MEWTDDRETTEEEDIVYCLLGILDVHMPTSYGEGRVKARMRLDDATCSARTTVAVRELILILTNRLLAP